MFGIRDWYKYVKEYTPETVFIDTRNVLLKKRLELILSNPATPLAFEGVSLEEFMKITKLDLRPLIRRINKAIERFGGKAFVRWNMAYPKDVCEFTKLEKPKGKMENVCYIKDGKEFFYLTFNSMRIVSIVDREPGELFPIAVRKIHNIQHEVRVFIEKERVLGAVHYYYDEDYGVDMEKLLKLMIRAGYEAYYMVPYHSATFDLGIDMDTKRLILVEINPPVSSGVTNPIYGDEKFWLKGDKNKVKLVWKEKGEWVVKEVPVSEVFSTQEL